VAGDTYFPILEPADWQETAREPHAADERHAHAFSFVVLERKRKPQRG
jgi:dihydrofolate reductase